MPDKTAAGRELDALVAEKVMGLVPMKGAGMVGGFWDSTKKRTQMVKDSPLHEARKKLGITDDEPGDGFTLAYSMDIRSAWAVVEKLRERGYILTLSGHRAAPWRAQFNDLPDACAENPAEAICKAALAALGAKAKERA